MGIPSLTAEELRQICPGANAKVLALITAHAPEVLPRYGIDTPLRVAHFLAQIAHEGMGWANESLRESMNYKSATRLAAIFGKGHHSCGLTQTECVDLIGKPEPLANRVYGPQTRVGRSLGNRDEGDGWTYRGAGLMQITGRGTFSKYGARLGMPLEDNPALAAGSAALELAALDWADAKCNEAADRNDLRSVTKRINGGHNGLAERERYFNAAWRVYGDQTVVADRSHATEVDLPGSRTIATAKLVKTIGGTIGTVSVGKAAGDAGALDGLTGITDQIGAARGVIDPMVDAVRWLTSAWWIGALVLAFLLWRYGGNLIHWRVEDHRMAKR